MVDIVLRSTGEVVGTTTLDFMNRQIEAHRSAAAAIEASRASDILDRLVKADALRDERAAFRAEVEERERIDAVRKFCDQVAELERRFARVEAAEQRRIAGAMAKLPDVDDPTGRSLEQQRQDFLQQAPLEAPEIEDNKQAEAMGVEEAIEAGRDDQGELPGNLAPLGNYPTLGRERPQLPPAPDISLNATTDDATPAFVCGRDRRAWRRRNRTWA
jgi:hypothetical protein